MNKFAKALLLVLVFAAPVTVFASQAQANTIHHTRVKSGKIHHTKHHKHHAKNLTHKTR
ncbi:MULTISPECIES: hypothetical protein [unclassified Nostoc]|uniref:hypothetical protein n=1 Tax=unclassified Nostoc TaxID=2593658 RepID=UPI002AD44D82|nr:hypothetical protein [Nostoc sp. DedQUE03]MDZ7974856.1 hypothetical protein [Nostoc sp. DedQUE03]MDZ8043018.1 hypothetical protein [Nostoc sp. DedQUE02]